MMNALRTGLFAAALAGLTFIPGPAAHGQVGTMSQDECRCVDSDGNEIENCRCLRTVDPGDFLVRAAPFSSSRPRLGITLGMTPDEDGARGAVVQGVLEDGPADDAGIREGDVITHFQGRSLFDPLADTEAEGDLDLDGSLPAQRLVHLVGDLEPGEEVEIRFLRDGETRTTTVEADNLDDWGSGVFLFGEDWQDRWDPEAFREEWEDVAEGLRSRDWHHFQVLPQDEGGIRFWSGPDRRDFFFQSPDSTGSPRERRIITVGPEAGRIQFTPGGWIGEGEYFDACPGSEESEDLLFLDRGCLGGIRMETMNPRLGEYFGATQGVLVADVHEESSLGLEPGDVILGVGNRETSDPGRLRRILRSYEPHEEIILRIMRQKREMEVTGTLGAPGGSSGT